MKGGVVTRLVKDKRKALKKAGAMNSYMRGACVVCWNKGEEFNRCRTAWGCLDCGLDDDPRNPHPYLCNGVCFTQYHEAKSQGKQLRQPVPGGLGKRKQGRKKAVAEA